MKLINYREYWDKLLLKEETLKDIIEKLKSVFSDEKELQFYIGILNKLPGGMGHKAQVAELFIRSKEERKRQRVTPEIIIQLIQDYLFVLSRNVKIDLMSLLKNDKLNHPDGSGSTLWTEFEQIVHHKSSDIKEKDAKKQAKKNAVNVKGDDENSDKPKTRYINYIYEDENIEIYEAKTPAQAQMYENDPDVFETFKSESNICLKNSYNFYNTYRFPYQSGFYFVFPKGKKTFIDIQDKKTRRAFILVESRLDGSAVWTYENNGMNFVRSIDEVIRLFPFFQPAKGIFQPRPITQEEKDDIEKVKNKLSESQFIQLPLKLKTLYIAMDHPLSDKEWQFITKEQKKDYVSSCYKKDLTDNQLKDIKQNKSLFEYYKIVKTRQLQSKIQSGQFLRVGITSHEAMFLPELLTGLDELTQNKIISGMIKLLETTLSSTTPPENISVGSIYKMFKQRILPVILQSTIIMNSIVDILSGEKQKTWNRVSNTQKREIYDVINDIYLTKADTIKPIVFGKIQRNIEGLATGLTTIPTSLQIEYFNENKDLLIKDKNFSDIFNKSIETHLTFGSDFPTWLKGYWKENKNDYFKNPEFLAIMKKNLISGLYGESSYEDTKFDSSSCSEESKEIYNLLINDINNDPKLLSVVMNTLYTNVVNNNKNIFEIDSWNITREFKTFCKQHEKDLHKWVAFKLIDSPPKFMRDDLENLINQYKDEIMSDPKLIKELEDHLIFDIVVNDTITDLDWESFRIKYWITNFDKIIKSDPRMEKLMVERIIKEWSSYSQANGFYVDIAVPLSFYKKHEKEILADEDAYQAIKTKVLDPFIWRQGNISDKEIFNTKLSPIEKDFFINHKNDVEVNEDGTKSTIFHPDKLKPQ